MSRRFSAQNYLFCRGWLSDVLLLLTLVGTAWGQTATADQIFRSRIAANRQKIDTATSWDASDDELGMLWLRLGFDYGEERDIALSEEA